VRQGRGLSTDKSDPPGGEQAMNSKLSISPQERWRQQKSRGKRKEVEEVIT